MANFDDVSSPSRSGNTTLDVSRVLERGAEDGNVLSITEVGDPSSARESCAAAISSDPSAPSAGDDATHHSDGNNTNLTEETRRHDCSADILKVGDNNPNSKDGDNDNRVNDCIGGGEKKTTAVGPFDRVTTPQDSPRMDDGADTAEVKTQPAAAEPRSLTKTPSSPPRSSRKPNDSKINDDCARQSGLGGFSRAPNERAVWVRQRLRISADLHVLQADSVLLDGRQETQARSGTTNDDSSAGPVHKRKHPSWQYESRHSSPPGKNTSIRSGVVADCSAERRGGSSRSGGDSRATPDTINNRGNDYARGTDTREDKRKTGSRKRDGRRRPNVSTGGEDGGREGLRHAGPRVQGGAARGD